MCLASVCVCVCMCVCVCVRACMRTCVRVSRWITGHCCCSCETWSAHLFTHCHPFNDLLACI